MMKVILLALVALVALAQAQEVGYAHLKGTSIDPTAEGHAYFVKWNSTHVWVWINANTTVNADALHGIHVHRFGDVSSADGSSASSHYVGGGVGVHACENTSQRHEGDMGNWQATGGNIHQTKVLDLLSISGANAIIGKAVVLHQQVDDCGITPNTGGAGDRLAYGVIGIANPANYPAEVLAAINGANLVNNSNVASSGDNVLRAIAVLTSTRANTATYPSVAGKVVFEQDVNTGAVTITGTFTGLQTTNSYGFHIHTFGDYYNSSTFALDGLVAGGHFNPTNSPHGGPTGLRHAGDLGNICTYDGTTAYYKFTVTDRSISLNGTSATNILGRNLIVHDTFDQAVSTFSAFGARVAFGVIGVADSTVANPITIPGTVNIISPPLCGASPTSTPTPTATPSPTPAPTSAPTAAPVATTTSAAASLVASALAALMVLVLLF